LGLQKASVLQSDLIVGPICCSCLKSKEVDYDWK